jgi:hypothetical protein
LKARRGPTGTSYTTREHLIFQICRVKIMKQYI